MVELGHGSREHAQSRESLGQAVGVGVELEHGRERRDGEFVDTQRPFHRVAFDARDKVGAADDDAGLWPPEKLVAAEGDEIGAGRERLARRRLVRQPEPAEVDQRAAPEIDREGHAACGAQPRNRGLGHRCREALDREVAGVDLHDQTGARADGGLVVLEVGAVGRADLAQLGAGARHHLGDAEGAADLDQLAARDRHLLA